MRRCRRIVLGIALTVALLGFFGREKLWDRPHQGDEEKAKASRESRETVDAGHESEPFEEILEGLGVLFEEEGTTAFYAASNSEMIVRNTEPGKVLA